MCVGHGVLRGGVPGRPLVRTGRALRQHPLMAEQVLEVAVVPLDRVPGPCTLDAAGDGVDALAAAKAVLPAEALLFDASALGCGADILGRIGRAVGLAEGVPAGDERHGLLVIHGHAGEGLADVPCRGDRVRLAIRSFRIHVDQPHLDGAQGVLELTVAAVALVAHPLGLGPPVDLLRLPDVLAPPGETEGLESHRIQGDVASQDHEVGPGELPAVLLLDRPEQATRLVEVPVVRPAVEGRKSLRSRASAAATIGDAVRARAVPRHANEERPVVAVVRGPPVLRIRHQGMEVLDDGIQVEALELLGVAERLAHGIRQRGIPVENLEVQLIGPPVGIRPGSGQCVPGRAAREWALRFVCHGLLLMVERLTFPTAPR